MESQLHRPEIAGLQSVSGGEGEHDQQQGEKKSVIKKVKDKAKKIKETITKHGHGHEHEYRHDQISEEEEDDDEDEVMVNAPDIHGAPMYTTPVIPGTNLPIQTDVNLEKPNDTREDRYTPNVRNEAYPNVGDEGAIRPSGPGKTGPEFEKSSVAARKPEFENLPKSRLDPTFMEETNVAEPMAQISPLMGLEEDPHSSKTHPAKIHPSNYQSKVTDPTGQGGKEAEVAPLLQRLDNFHIHDESKSKSPVSEAETYTGSHDQFAPQPTPTEGILNPEPNPVENPEMPKSIDPSKPRDTIAGKISSATSAVVDKAITAKNAVASKMGYGGQQHHNESKKPVTDLATEYGHKVYEKVAGTGSAVLSKVHKSGEAGNVGGDRESAKGGDKGVSVKEYLAEKLRPGDEDKALSDAITERFHRQRTEAEVTPVGSEGAAAPSGAGKEVRSGGVVDRLRGAVGSWLGPSHVSDAGVSSVHSKEVIGDQQPRLQSPET